MPPPGRGTPQRQARGWPCRPRPAGERVPACRAALQSPARGAPPAGRCPPRTCSTRYLVPAVSGKCARDAAEAVWGNGQQEGKRKQGRAAQPVFTLLRRIPCRTVRQSTTTWAPPVPLPVGTATGTEQRAWPFLQRQRHLWLCQYFFSPCGSSRKRRSEMMYSRPIRRAPARRGSQERAQLAIGNSCSGGGGQQGMPGISLVHVPSMAGVPARHSFLHSSCCKAPPKHPENPPATPTRVEPAALSGDGAATLIKPQAVQAGRAAQCNTQPTAAAQLTRLV